ncbi:tetratricopeptide repeat protein [Bartonella sp. B30(2025)]
MLLLIWVTIFFLFLAIILFFRSGFVIGKNKERQFFTFNVYRNCMQFVVFNKIFTRCKNKHILKVCSVLFVIFITWSIYSLTGNPKAKSYFFSELMDKDPEILSKDEQLVRLQVLFLRTPNDGKLADMLAVGYLEEGYFQEAVNIYLDALRLNGESAPRLVGYGLALVGYEGGMITQKAQNAFKKAVDLAPKDFYPRLLLAGAFRQEGKLMQAIQYLQDFLDTMPEDFSGRLHIEAMITRLRVLLQSEYPESADD